MNKDPLLNDVKQFILERQFVSVSAIQRRFQIGFMRAERILDQLEKDRFVSKKDKNFRRKIVEEKYEKKVRFALGWAEFFDKENEVKK
ncbi:hypothetical protein BKK49_05595 [Rodentibacter rarus]|uniref:FtsK gamma domain-containing protein n=1 Tax=Rodentibacter rarus TaxID=1908260 RepID=A0A1V3IKU3_9PAST|nr:DNA translocase FtsK [Rodentibacter rarus]OOF40926.1 hypothetical protein BKK49_05595 [Rodentibacter rarus]OOF41986.1 hypothetical protein BKK50_07785 [Rodentibacter rarus]